MELHEYLSSEAGKAAPQAEWARRARITRGYLNQLAKGRKQPSIDVAYRIEVMTDGAVSMASWVSDGNLEDTKSGELGNTGLRGAVTA